MAETCLQLEKEPLTTSGGVRKSLLSRGAVQQTWGSCLEEAHWLGMLWEADGWGWDRSCDTLGNQGVNERKTLSPPLVSKRRWEYRKSELHTSHSPMLLELDQIWVPEIKNQEPADKSLLVLPPWQPLNESLNLHRHLSAFSSLLAKQSTHCRMHTLNDSVD